MQAPTIPPAVPFPLWSTVLSAVTSTPGNGTFSAGPIGGVPPPAPTNVTQSPGANNLTGPGANNLTGPGANNLTGPGANNLTGPGANNLTGPGANNLTGPGANNLTDQVCADGNLPDVTTGLCADGSQPQAFNTTASPTTPPNLPEPSEFAVMVQHLMPLLVSVLMVPNHNHNLPTLQLHLSRLQANN